MQAWGYELIDCQVYTGYMADFGAGYIARQDFEVLLDMFCRETVEPDWSADPMKGCC